MNPQLRDLFANQRFWWTTAGGTALALIGLGLLSGIIPNPLVVRTIPTRLADVVVWLASAPLIGVVLATYVVRPHRADHADHGQLRVGIGGVAVYFAIACPVCNKLILLALGLSGALNVFAPIQPFIGAVSLAFLGATLVDRARLHALCGRGGGVGGWPRHWIVCSGRGRGWMEPRAGRPSFVMRARPPAEEIGRASRATSSATARPGA